MKTKYLSFDCSRLEARIIDQIADRAVADAKKRGIEYGLQTAIMDITACHCNGCALDLDKLRDADDFNFFHDIYGIRRHINRRTGEMMDCFLPRCAMPMAFGE